MVPHPDSRWGQYRLEPAVKLHGRVLTSRQGSAVQWHGSLAGTADAAGAFRIEGVPRIPGATNGSCSPAIRVETLRR